MPGDWYALLTSEAIPTPSSASSAGAALSRAWRRRNGDQGTPGASCIATFDTCDGSSAWRSRKSRPSTTLTCTSERSAVLWTSTTCVGSIDFTRAACSRYSTRYRISVADCRNPGEFVIRLDVPGVHKENLDLKLFGEVLTIVGRRDEVKEYRAGTALWREREAGKFLRTIRLPAPVDEKKVEAAYQDGILTVTLLKAPAAVGEKILIK